MHRPALVQHEYLHRPRWEWQFMLGKFKLHLALSCDQDQEHMARFLIANRIAALRMEQGLSVQELAFRLAIHPTTLNALENGHYLPTLELAMRLSIFFHQPIEAIFSYLADENTFAV